MILLIFFLGKLGIIYLLLLLIIIIVTFLVPAEELSPSISLSGVFSASLLHWLHLCGLTRMLDFGTASWRLPGLHFLPRMAPHSSLPVWRRSASTSCSHTEYPPTLPLVLPTAQVNSSL